MSYPVLCTLQQFAGNETPQWLCHSSLEPHLESLLISTDLENNGSWRDVHLIPSDLRVCDFTWQKRIKTIKTTTKGHITDQLTFQEVC